MLRYSSQRKLYMWLKVSSEASPIENERKQALKLVNEVVTVMPATWSPSLDKQVAEHLERFH